MITPFFLLGDNNISYARFDFEKSLKNQTKAKFLSCPVDDKFKVKHLWAVLSGFIPKSLFKNKSFLKPHFRHAIKTLQNRLKTYKK
ncbi:hypothetical protein BpHYR1_054142 [Brachionus plicatilis]|uniref:Uncharacterized protein n=1 Tax=Brachionus plicatilis TaxID=10195 RepID=A0A3M7S8T5_BRAPC|nr:hypothetical protein BpHYR1_054142 [Brachionus plicatilis]